jgi:enoyl-CoA hydratase/carnithine racemase
MEMALAGDLYDAATAERFGLINRVVPAGQALIEAQKLAAGIAARSAATLAIGKRAFYAQIEAPLAEAYALGARAMIDNLAHPDASEGAAAFLDKRAPRWEGG